MGRLIYLTGPVRSGKSRRAVELARAWGDSVVFVATYRPNSADQEMEERIRRHRAERPAWRTLDAPADVAGALAAILPPPAGAVIDCLTLWLADRLVQSDHSLRAGWERQIAAMRAAPWPVIIVGNEIGWSPVPPDPALRRFRDLAGWLAQATAAAADEAWLMVAGCPMRLK